MRVWIKLCFIMCFAPMFAGCLSTLGAIGGVISGVNGAVSLIQNGYNRQPEPRAELKQHAYEEGFRAGMRSVATEFRTKEEMNKPYVWRPPLVSDVDMPARIVNGVMIPAHTEPVIVSPGYWVRTESVSLD